jgi:hypothetical protein
MFMLIVYRWTGKELERKELTFTSGIPREIVKRELPPLEADGWVLSGDAVKARARAAYKARQSAKGDR